MVPFARAAGAPDGAILSDPIGHAFLTDSVVARARLTFLQRQPVQPDCV